MKRYLPLQSGQKRGCREQPLFYSHSLRTHKLPREMTIPAPPGIPSLSRDPSNSYLTALLRDHLRLHTQIPAWGNPQSPVRKKSCGHLGKVFMKGDHTFYSLPLLEAKVRSGAARRVPSVPFTQEVTSYKSKFEAQHQVGLKIPI